jgi:sugar O-acyltransferase (sialic acid O-acetyltransferase NeuD family)
VPELGAETTEKEQPEGLRDTTLWSQTTGKRNLICGHPEQGASFCDQGGVRSCTFQCAEDQRDFFPVVSATTGYYLAALRAAQTDLGGRSILLPEKDPMKKLVIFGNSAFAELAHHYFQYDSEYSVVAFTVDAAYLREATFKHLPVIAFEDLAKEFPATECDLFVAMGIQQVNQQRAAKVAAAEAIGYKLASFVSSKAKVSEDLLMRPNSMVMDGAHLQPFVEIGRDTIIWSGCGIGFRSRIGNHCWLVATTLGESVVVGDYSFIGLGSTIAPSRSIGASNVIGAGALILHDTKDFEVYKGHASVPSRVPSTRLRRI